MSDKNQTQVTVLGRFIGGGLFEARQGDEDAVPKFSACVVLEDGEEKKIEKIRDIAVKEKLGSKPGKYVDWTVREGDDPEYDASYEKFFINPKAQRAIKTMIKRNGVAEPVSKEDDIIYPGCYVAISVSAYAYSANPKKRIKAGVTLNARGVMFWKDGERLDDYMNAEEEFGDFESEVKEDDDDSMYD